MYLKATIGSQFQIVGRTGWGSISYRLSRTTTNCLFDHVIRDQLASSKLLQSLVPKVVVKLH